MRATGTSAARRAAAPECGAAREAREGVLDVAPAAIAAVPIGLLFGALAAAKGLSVAEVALMSALVCAGGAQFAILELWTYPVPVGTIVASTLLINLRHVLMGASIAPKTAAFRAWQRLLTFYALVDETWAFGERRAQTPPLTPAYFGAMGATLWLNWVTFSTLGAVAGTFLGDPTAVGADFAFTALFIGIVAALWRGAATAVPVIAAAVTGALTYHSIGTPWHVLAGRRRGHRGRGACLASDGYAHDHRPRPGPDDRRDGARHLRDADRRAGSQGPPEGRPARRAALDAIPPAVLIAVISPSLLATGWRETVASAVTIVAATRLPLIGRSRPAFSRSSRCATSRADEAQRATSPRQSRRTLRDRLRRRYSGAKFRHRTGSRAWTRTSRRSPGARARGPRFPPASAALHPHPSRRAMLDRFWYCFGHDSG